MPAREFHRELSSDVDTIGRLLADLALWCRQAQVPTAVVDPATLMVDELLTNTAMHGYQGSSTGWISVRASVEDRSLVIVLRDHGPAFDPRTMPLPDTTLPMEQRRIGGLGLLFVRRMADVLDYRRIDDSPRTAMNEVRLVKRFPPVGAGSDAAVQPGTAGH